jgi:hypothetical protein
MTLSEIATAAILAFGSKSRIKFLKEMPDIPDLKFKPSTTLFRSIRYYPQISLSLGMQKEAIDRKSTRG